MRRVSYIALLPFTCAVGLWAAPSPAVAAEDSFLALGNVGSLFNFSKQREAIDFTERAPLVVPPTNTLPPPGSGAPEAATVNDPDLAARRRALADSRRPVPPSDPGATQTGLNARAFLIDPPSGLRNPQVVAGDITTDRTTGSIKPSRHRHASKKMQVEQASQ